MSWLTDVIKPKIKALITRKKEMPENLWVKCLKCDHMLFNRDFILNKKVCHYCQHHMILDAESRLKLLFDHQDYHEIPVPSVVMDPLKFKDTKKYSDRLKEYRQKIGRNDAVVIASGQIGQKNAVVYILDFNFMGGSMGMAAGEGLLEASRIAVQTRSALVVVTGSGGARMQEGILSLMQMARTTIAVQNVKDAGLPYITILTNPTTGGVSASFAMLGDIAIAEPGATIGFSGARVIEETMRQKLPDNFQKSEFLKDHGMIDIVVHRNDLRDTLSTVLGHLMGKKSLQRLSS
ncbi:MAG: acetyl-CoA carboxylase carboxyltransferase subunit beta [Proteobacteria bacterium]|nr:acetyl-CoA carboxylase carboxyltransferase subunit beta [Pseudomonadota bacterium]